MKRLNAIISTVVFLFFTGCSSYPHQSWLEDRSFDKIADDRASEIVTALEMEIKLQLDPCFLIRH